MKVWNCIHGIKILWYASFLMFTITFATHHNELNTYDKPHTKKYVIGVHRAGFFSSFLGVLNHLTLCQQINEVPIVYWDSSSHYYLADGFNGSHNVWEYYFEPVSNLIYDPSKDTVHGSYGGQYAEFYYNDFSPSTRNKAYGLISKYIRIKPQVQHKIDDFYQQNMAGKHTIGIHLRGTDKVVEERPVSPEDIIEAALAQAVETTQFFVASDEQQLLDKAVYLLQGYKVIFYDCYRSDNGKPLHARKEKQSLAQVGEDVLVEVSLFARCDVLVHTLSNVSTGALYFNPSLKSVLLYSDGGSTSVIKSSEGELDKIKIYESSCMTNNDINSLIREKTSNNLELYNN